LPDSRPHIQHINRLLSEQPTVIHFRPLITGEDYNCRKDTVDRGDVNTYVVMYRSNKTFVL